MTEKEIAMNGITARNINSNVSYQLDPSWGALAIAVLFECPVSPEEAMELYDTGSIAISGRRYKSSTLIKSCMIDRLRKRGIAWWAIREITGILSPESYFSHRRGLVAEVKRRKKKVF